MIQRNRSEGWEHAKRSGHENERLVAELTASDLLVQKMILRCAHADNDTIERIEYGGICEKDVECIFPGEKTKSKTDMWLFLSSGRRVNVSIKKDESGQVFLISIDRFIRGFELQYNQVIPPDVKRAIQLYFGSAQDIPEIIEEFAFNNISLQTRKHRLVADTLYAYDEYLADLLIYWINTHIYELFDFCFARGLAKNPEDWAHIVWYKNLVDGETLDTLINLSDIACSISSTAAYGPRNGGSTIQLPFGFVQWHSPRKIIPGNIQFHHDYEKMLKLHI